MTDLISRIAAKAKANNFTGEQVVKIPINSIKNHPKNHLYFRDLDRQMKDKLMEDMRDNGQITYLVLLSPLISRIPQTLYQP